MNASAPSTTIFSDTPERADRAEAVIFSLLVGLISTMALGYYFGLINHIEQLPQILRLLDSGFLRNDFAVNATAGYGPRFYYSWLLALLGRLAPLPLVFFLFTWIQNAGVALITFLVGRRLAFGVAADAAGRLAAVLAVTVNSINLGEAGFLRLPGLIPASLVTALALWSLWEGLNDRPWLCALLAAIASLFHPLLGLEAGLVGLSTAFIDQALFRNDHAARVTRWPSIRKTLLAGGALGLLGIAVWVLPQQPALLSSVEMVQVHAHFRNPHHILPSAFPLHDWLAAGSFLVAFLIIWLRRLRRPETEQLRNRRLLIAVVVVLALFVCGWFFVEVVPTRLVATLQLYRLTLVIKWLGLALLGIEAARALRGPVSTGSPLLAMAIIAPVGHLQSFAAPLVQLAGLARDRLKSRRWQLALGIITAAAVIAGLIWLRGDGGSTQLFALAACGLVSLAFRFTKRRAVRLAAATAVALAVASLPLANQHFRLPFIGGLLDATRPVFTLEQGRDASDSIARFCQERTPDDAIFVVPPLLGRFRYTARRAIVVDFKYAMAHDWAIIEWLQRLHDCYGRPTERGFRAAGEMEWRYRRISEGRLLFLREKYGTSFAVLFAETPCDFPALYSDEDYKLVEIPEPIRVR